jgi:hypothetical protein
MLRAEDCARACKRQRGGAVCCAENIMISGWPGQDLLVCRSTALAITMLVQRNVQQLPMPSPIGALITCFTLRDHTTQLVASEGCMLGASRIFVTTQRTMSSQATRVHAQASTEESWWGSEDRSKYIEVCRLQLVVEGGAGILHDVGVIFPKESDPVAKHRVC